MADALEPKPQGNPQDNGKKKDLTLTIKLPEQGNIEVMGPGDGKLFNKPLCYLLLEEAKDHIKRHNAIETAPKIVRPGFKSRIKGAFGK